MVDLLLVRAKNGAAVFSSGHSGRKIGCYTPPYSLLWIDDYVTKAGFSVTIIDRFRPDYYAMTVDVLAAYLVAMRPSVIGISALTSQSVDAIALAGAVKKIADVPVVFGGPHFSGLPGSALNYGDAVVVGEGEKALVEMLREPQRIKEGIIQGLPLSEKEMDTISFLSKRSLARTGFVPHLQREYSILTARGCPFNCVFCKDDSRRYTVRYHSAEYVVAMLEFAYRQFGYTRYFIMDDVFACSMKRLEAIAFGLEQKQLKFNFTCFLHANVVRHELLVVLKKIGVTRVSIGVESGNDNILHLIQKNTTTETLRETVMMCKQHGLYVNALFMLGNIGETVLTMKETIRFAGSLPSDHDWFSFANPFPGTRFYQLVPEYGTIIQPDFGKWSNEEIVYLPKGVSKSQLKRLMRMAQVERGMTMIKSFVRRGVGRVKAMFSGDST